MFSWADIHYNQPECSSPRAKQGVQYRGDGELQICEATQIRVKAVFLTVVSSQQHIDFLWNAFRPSFLASLLSDNTLPPLQVNDKKMFNDNTFVVFRPLEKQCSVKFGIASYFTVGTMWDHPGKLFHESEGRGVCLAYICRRCLLLEGRLAVFVS